MPKTCPTCDGTRRVQRSISRTWWQVLLLQPATADELCPTCVGTGLVKGSPEEERELDLRRQQYREAQERELAAERTQRQQAQERITAEERARASSPAARAADNEHYILKCKECGFTLHVPRDCSDPTFTYTVTPEEVKLACVYGGRFTVSLEVKDFFTITTTLASGRTLQASIGPNMRSLHGHMLSHCDPLYLVIQQSSSRTIHAYRRRPEGSTYVKFSQNRGVDIIGNINVSKAEIPGVSD